MNFQTEHGKRFRQRIRGDFKVEEIPEKVIHVDENTILDYIEEQSYHLEEMR